jgi:dipeptidyl aminopeptidase/acylaminoacyl peptidase
MNASSARSATRLIANERSELWRIGCVLVLVSIALVGQGVAADLARPVVIDDYFTLGLLNEVAVSSAAKAVAYTEGRWQESSNDRKTDLWIAPMTGETPRRITFDRAGYDTLRWSPDGKYVFCASTISLPEGSASRQIVRIAADGSGVVPVSRADGGIESFEISPSGDSVVYTTSSEEDSSEWSSLRTTFSELEYGTRKRVKTSFHRIDFETWRTTPLGVYAGAVDSFALSPDQKRIAMVTAPDSAVITMEGQSEITLLEIATGEAKDLPDDAWRRNLPSDYGRLTAPQWSSDGRALAFAIGFDAYPSEVFIAEWKDGDVPTIRKLQRPGTVSLHGGVDGGVTLCWQGNSRDLLFLGDDRARVKIYCAKDVTAGGVVECLTDNDVVVDTFSCDPDGKWIAAVIGKPDKMHDVHLCATQENDWKQLTEINAHTNSWKLPKISIVSWEGEGGKRVEGVLELPAGYERGAPLPTIVHLHGGPTSAWSLNMVYGFTGSVLYASQGYAFFSPNYRGSTGYGDAFITDLVGRENEVEVADILRGIDRLIADGIIDKDRIAVAGWSNGGFLTNCLISKTDRFKAASSGAGIADLTMEWGTNDEPAFPRIFSGGTPWQVPDVYRRASPIFRFGGVKTPTLFHVGENDPRCPKGQSEMPYRALNEELKVETELLIYPGEGHGLAQYSSRKAKLAWELAWFDHFVKGSPTP